MTVFSGGEAITEFLAEFDGWLSEPVAVYLLGGSAMTVHGLKDQTEDIDLALAVTTEFEHVHQTLQQHGFEVIDEPTESFDGVGKTTLANIEDAYPSLTAITVASPESLTEIDGVGEQTASISSDRF